MFGRHEWCHLLSARDVSNSMNHDYFYLDFTRNEENSEPIKHIFNHKRTWCNYCWTWDFWTM